MKHERVLRADRIKAQKYLIYALICAAIMLFNPLWNPIQFPMIYFIYKAYKHGNRSNLF